MGSSRWSPSSQHFTDEAQKAETVLSAVSYTRDYIYIYIYIYKSKHPRQRLAVATPSFTPVGDFQATGQLPEDRQPA